ncbi:MAG TPA: galactokinase family protein [Gemmatimonadaceae bacterium]|nr:galactokinase family protein [Gemmatimonadaceae bacterium]
MIAARAERSGVERRSLAEVRAAGDEIWFQRGLDRLRDLRSETDQRLRTFFSESAPVYIARAPGRLDVMGGIADYSGSLVLELPLDCATMAILQPQPSPRCDLATRRAERWDFFTIDLPLLTSGAELSTPAALAAWFTRRQGARWASYIVGVVQRFLERTVREGGTSPTGVRLLIDSAVPSGRGVASSAALEVAAAMAVTAACGSAMSASELATLCQAVENEVVGAPCGIMDQMTSACGRRNSLLRLLCQPGTIEGHVTIPDGYRFYGIDSGISHAVSGADYGTVRTAAFMGLRMITARAGLKATRENTRLRIDDNRWRGYLANLSENELAELGQGLPREMSGAQFIKKYEGITDAATVVRPRSRYPVLAATAHPVREHARVRQFADLLSSLAERPKAAVEMGRLMYESHRSYGACGLGSDGTDRLVEMVAAIGAERGLFGAKITGGGSGGTVAVFGTADAARAVRDVATRYAAETGRRATIFAESGPGAAETGVLSLASPDEAALRF